MLCPCGSALNFTTCCQRFISSAQTPAKNLPETAEQLMRSRFSAYATQNGPYIYQTYATSSQKKHSLVDIQRWSQACIWLGLNIHRPKRQKGNDSTTHITDCYVEFSAFYLHEHSLYQMREKSRFVQEIDDNSQLAWRYIDGKILKKSELKKIKRNDLCPCNNYKNNKRAKKYKHCCKEKLSSN